MYLCVFNNRFGFRLLKGLPDRCSLDLFFYLRTYIYSCLWITIGINSDYPSPLCTILTNLSCFMYQYFRTSRSILLTTHFRLFMIILDFTCVRPSWSSSFNFVFHVVSTPFVPLSFIRSMSKQPQHNGLNFWHYVQIGLRAWITIFLTLYNS